MANKNTQPVSIFRKTSSPDIDAIPLLQNDLEDLVARTNAITYLTDKRQEHVDEALRCEAMAVFLQEALTLWIERTYHVDATEQQWHLDLNERRLVRIQSGETL